MLSLLVVVAFLAVSALREHIIAQVRTPPRKVDVRLPEKGNSNSHGARPVHLIITMIKWTRTSRLAMVVVAFLAVSALREHIIAQVFFFFFITLVTGPRRSLSLKLSDTKVCEP